MISSIGAVLGLFIAIIFVLLKYPPFYSLAIGAILGGLFGGANITQTIDFMISGTSGITTSVLRILAAGVLSGALIKTNSAKSITESICKIFPIKWAIIAVILSTYILTAVGVFIDIAVITVAPIALNLAQKTKTNRIALLFAMIGGGKAGNLISPNPNTIAASEAFKVDLFSLQTTNFIPSLFGLVVTLIFTIYLNRNQKNQIETNEINEKDDDGYPNFFIAILGPIVTIALLSLRPIAKINIDPIIALPAGGLFTILISGNFKNTSEIISYGLSKMTGVSTILLGTGTISGIIKNSKIKDDLVSVLNDFGISAKFLAPLSSILMSGATASTTAGTVVASSTFAETILSAGIPALTAAAILHSGAVVLDHLPHGSFFHATAGCVNMDLKTRLKLIPFESLVGLSLVISSMLFHM